MAPPHARPDPAVDAAALLRRLGIASLALGIPVAALLSRRGIVLFLPIGVALLVLAGALDGTFRPLRENLARFSGSVCAAAIAFCAAWACVSLLWTTDPANSAERLGGILGSIGLGLAAYLLLPPRMRSANLSLVPIGAALAALVAIAILAGRFGGDVADGPTVERGLAVLALFAWPAIAWLRSRERDRRAAALVALVSVAIVLGPGAGASFAFAVGAFAYVCTSLAPRTTPVAVGILALVLALGPPVLPLADALLRRAPVGPDLLSSASAWNAAILADPLRILTGHGFGSLVRDRVAGRIPDGTPDMALLQVWYELGLPGALAVAAALFAAPIAAVRHYGPLLPGLVGAVATALALVCLGIGSSQAWWPAAIVALILLFVALQRGQFRTQRPFAERAVPAARAVVQAPVRPRTRRPRTTDL